MKTLSELYRAIKRQFEVGGIDAPELDAKYLIQAVTGKVEEDFILNADSVIEDQDLEIINNYVLRRLNNEPVSKILGEKEFWGRKFKVSQDTLDPRPDSETLIDAVLNYVKHSQLDDKPLRLLDLGTGSGCLLITLLAELPKAQGVAVDISREAMAIALENAIANNAHERFDGRIGSWTEGLDLSEFDIIVSNPPYIPEGEIRNLSLEVQNHDPILALEGGESGLDCYQIIFNSIKNEKLFKGHAFFEIGFDQHEDILRLVDDSTLLHCDSIRDLGGHIRVVEICRGDK